MPKRGTPVRRSARKANRKPFAYGTVVEALSSGLYPDKRHILREFIQNAFDSTMDYAKATDLSQIRPIEVKIEGSSVFIGDKGLGMDKQDVQTYRYLGYSSKTRGTNVGFRGIGKSSGHAAAEKIVVRTSKLGVPWMYEGVIDAKGEKRDTSPISGRCQDAALLRHC